jgi:hypothetical protein
MPAGAVSIVVTSLTPAAFEKVSYGFESIAEQTIDEKLEWTD